MIKSITDRIDHSCLSFLLARETVSVSSRRVNARNANSLPSKMSYNHLLASPHPPPLDMPTRCFRYAKHVSRRHRGGSHFATRRWEVARRGERGGVEIGVEITRALTPSLERLANKSSTFLTDVARGDSSEKQPGRREFRRSGPVDRKGSRRGDSWRERTGIVLVDDASRRMRLFPGC